MCCIRDAKTAETLPLHSRNEEYRREPLNEERVRQILDIEGHAGAIYQEAVQKAEELPDQVEREAQTLLEKARTEAQSQARELLDEAQATDACARILDQARAEAERRENLAQSHFDRAVSYVLDRLAGKE
jgi:vacuolar-type H+-ATPase subunit H